MTLLIAHRGNWAGKNPERENSPKYLLEAIESGYNVETDVWWHQGKFWLGHDAPIYQTTVDFLSNPNIWCHAKSLETVVELRKHDSIHWFWHETDKITLTSKGYIWTFPRINLTEAVVNQPKDIIKAYKNKPFAICANDFNKLHTLKEK